MKDCFRRFAAPVVVLALCAVMLSACATLSLRPFNPYRHGTVYAEWVPHRGAGEWWYVTGYLNNAQGELWLYQLTIFHQAKGLGQGYLLDLALSDYQTGRHIFEEYATTDAKRAYGRDGSIVFGKSSITLTHSNVKVVGVGKELSFSLRLVPEKPPVWQADNGVVGMGHPGQSTEMSYYYSFTRLRTTGQISYADRAGNYVTRELVGSSWIDRQWGHFSESGWDWFSIRLFDGSDIMLYAFPSTGFGEGTLSGPHGKTSSLRGFNYRTLSWQTRDGSRYGLHWRVDLPSLGKTFQIVAISPNDYNPNRVMHYWEGLCRVYDEKGKLVGYSVEETTASAHRLSSAGGQTP